MIAGELAALRTARTVLRRWRPADRAPFAHLNADPDVTRFLPGPLDRSASDALADRIEAHLEARGFGLWALELPGVAVFAGFVGLAVVPFDPPFAAATSPPVEIGWRLDRQRWGHGYATEAAGAALAHALGPLGLPEVVSFTTEGNARSRAVMERIGLVHDPGGDFDHPSLPPGHPLRRHVLYRGAGWPGGGTPA